ncbi:MAG: N-6 DNA methylase [Bacteroidales bacterium]|nr:N-6 DNA methylase [Bacteroidales bacterium]
MDLFLSAEISKPKKLIYRKDLQPINNLKIVFREIRDYFAGNVTGISRDEKIAQNIMRILFCKIYDEKVKQADELVDIGNRPNETLKDFQNRINKVFEVVKETYSDIFENDEIIEINSAELSYIISKLENSSLLDADRDIIADAFEELIGTSFRGGEGQFFTPRNVVQMMIDILQPKEGDKIIDPACGSGGFLAHILQHLQKQKTKNYYITGIDKDLFLSKLAKIYLTLLGENEYHVFCENSLEEPKKWSSVTNETIQLGTFDLILTNPPFGAKIPVIGDNLLRQYELGYYWKNGGENWNLTNKIREKQPPQILFIERIIQLLKDGGRAGIILPEGIFGNPSDRYIWEYIRKYASILGIISLSQETFQPSTHTKTSVVFLEKKKQSQKQIFMAIANAIGHDKNGKEIFKIDKDGSTIYDKNGQKKLDDETPEIAENFQQFLNGGIKKISRLGFTVNTEEIRENIYIPENYSPELAIRLKELEESGKYKLTTIKELLDKNILQIRRGNEIGSRNYGTGEIPFVRTTDIVNWEIKMNPVKGISEKIYEKYRKSQDVKENDILFVNDGTFLIGRCSLVSKLDVRCVIQSHLRKIRVMPNDEINAYYLFYLLNTKIVQKQVEVHTFVQATLSTLGNRINEIILPILTDKQEIERISNEIKHIIDTKVEIRELSNKLMIESE